MQLTGTFPEGVIIDGQLFCDFILTEHQFRHTMALASDPAVDVKKLDDPVYYQAAVMAKRLQLVDGPDSLTPEQILDLSGADGQELIAVAGDLEQQRKAFRDAAQAAPAGHGVLAETGS